MKKCLVFLLLASAVFKVQAQGDSTVYQLDEVVLVDNLLKDFSTGQTLVTISDSTMLKNTPSLTNILNQHTGIYFKQNGLGMVSSPSFRGTTASQTAVLWNGININSKFNGQLDFNTINAGNFESISVRAGGGSLVYGSGAIGGTVHLNNVLKYNSEWTNQFHVKYGSFNTLDARYKTQAGGENWATTVSVVRFSSDNDYNYPNSDNFNRNGQFQNTGINASLAFKLNKIHSLRFYSQFFNGERHFSLIRPSENKTKYKDLNYRNLLEWRSDFGKFESSTRVAFLSEKYKYFPNIENDRFTFGKAQTFIGKYTADYKFSNSEQLTGILSFNSTKGEGSNIPEEQRNIGAFVLLWKQAINPKWNYEVGGRKELTSVYDSPLLFNFGTEYQVTDYYRLKLNGSKNFRIPTFNDLYWTGNENVDLKPETSYQVELGNQFSGKNWKVNLTGFYNDIDNLIQWIPQSSGFWSPENRENVHTYGAELYASGSKSFGNHHFQLSGNYSYTLSKNQKTGNQLIYVPYRKAATNLNYEFKRFFVNYQLRLIGDVFTRSDNNPENVLPGYAISNFGLGYHFGKHRQLTAGTQLNNIFDIYYQNVEDRIMPGIHFNFYLTLNF
jgi:iron complex outermembrane receptor protein